jgi:multidrug efflux pump subunit AcrB
MILERRALLVAVPALLLAAGCSRSTADPLPAVTVEASYPGANAQVVADTVAAPVEQQVNGVEKMVQMTSRSANDGTYRLTVTFERGTDPNVAQVLVQNRVALAEPILPDVVKRDGMAVKKISPGGPLALVAVSSPGGRFDTVWLSNYAALQVQDELARIPGVGDVMPFGERERGLVVWLDPAKLAAFDLTVRDVTQALEQQNAQVAAGPVAAGPGGANRLAVNAPGRLADADQFENIVLKAGDGQVVRLKDVARVELGAAAAQDQANLNGKPVVLLALYLLPGSRPRAVGPAVAAKVAELRARCPDGAQVDVAFDFAPNLEGWSTAPEYLLLDLALPAGASAERTFQAVRRCEALVREVGGVQDVLALSGNPFDRRRDRPCLLVRLAPARGRSASREQIAKAIRDRLGQVEEAALRLRDLSAPGAFPRCGYPIDLAVYGDELDRVQAWATKLAERLGQSPKLTDVWADRDAAPQPQLSLDIDRTQAQMLGVSLQDIMTTLDACTGWQSANDFGRTGQTWQVRVPPEANRGDRVQDLQRLKVRNAQGQMVPLSALATVREVSGPEAVDRFNLRPMVEITANPAAGVSATQARTLCEGLAEEVRKELGLPAGYRLAWLR